MKAKRLTENRLALIAVSLFLILFIGFVDYRTGSEISFSLFYIFPLILVAVSEKSSRIQVIMIAIFSAIVWFLADYSIREHPNAIISLWNAFVRLSIFLGIGLLVHNLKAQQRRIRLINEGLQELNAEKNKFIGIAAHDIRNPISTIFSFSDLLLSEEKVRLDDDVIRKLNYIRELSKNALMLLKDLLDVSKIETGNIYYSLKLHNYIDFLTVRIYMNQLLADKKDIKIALEADDPALSFNFDEKYLAEVVDNLLTNAIKFSNPGSRVIVKVTDLPNGNIRTEVIDEGIGIPADEQHKLFQYFQKTSTEPTGGEGSTGLGLAIAKKIVSIHEGWIGVKSEPGKGSEFYFELPRQVKKEYTQMQ